MASRTFKLYRLPSIALAVVFHCMNHTALFRLSLLSKKSYQITKSLRKKNGTLKIALTSKASMSFNGYRLFHLLGSEEFDQSQNGWVSETLNFKNTKLRIKFGRIIEGLYIDCGRHFELRTFFEYAIEFYGLSIGVLLIENRNPWHVSKGVFEWVMSRQDTLSKLYFYCNEIEQFKYVLDTIQNRVTMNLELETVASETFRYNFSPPLTTETIVLGKTPWITVDNLFELNPRNLLIEGITLTCQNMNSFLRRWQEGENSISRRIRFFLPSVDTDVMFSELDVLIINHPNVIVYEVDETEEHHLDTTFELKRRDGTIASILIDFEDIEFIMLIWPDRQNRPYPVQEEE